MNIGIVYMEKGKSDRAIDGSGEVNVLKLSCEKLLEHKKNKETWSVPPRNVNVKKDKYKCDFIWIIWEIIFEELKCRHEKIVNTIIKVLYSLFIHGYTSGKRTERMFIVYNAIGHLTNKIEYNKPIRLNEVLYIQTQSNINKI